ncbi:MAG: SDR family oxidoreductase [Desulfobacterales bacterium]
MDQKCILITGAASGIGRETALLFAKNGWYVGAFDVDEAGLKTLAEEIGTDNCHIGHMDVAEAASVQRGVDGFAGKTDGNLHILLNNAGILALGFFENEALAIHHKIVDINFKGCLNCIYYSLPYLKTTMGAKIINMSSVSSVYGIPEVGVYSATKSALDAMAEALSIELEPYGIHVCNIRPPYVKTPMLDGADNIKSMRALRSLFGFINPEKVAETVWKAAHRNKLYWNIGISGPMFFFTWLMPFATRLVVKFFGMPKVSKYNLMDN